ncbi:MAG: hypothetical protein H6925_04825 [Holosporaceae bacterium]|nr:MAG: hypothetical protein H6925_04825 [Holosporaceae bacterium]
MNDISVEAFAHYEVLRGLQEAYDNLTTLVQSLSEGDASALDELPPEISVLVEDMRADRMTFENMVQHPYVFFMVQITSAMNGWGRLWAPPNKTKSILATRWRGKS